MASLGDLARPSGRFAMVAMDQRESLRTMIAERGGTPLDAVPDAALIDFKVAVASVLSPIASALLVDRDFGLDATLSAGALAAGCGLIVAADRLEQLPGQPVTDTALDDRVDPEQVRVLGAAALKLLVIWRDDGGGDRRLAMTRDFVRRCREAGLVSLVEGVVRPVPGRPAHTFDRERAIVEAAGALGACEPDLYKGEVPFHGHAGAGAIADVARLVTESLDCPWVVLSQGVDPDDFAPAVAAALEGGASGFLAGRGIWTDAIAGVSDRAGYEAAVRERAVPRLRRLVEVVDAV
jgi:sulfofructosephosphate aldolase